MKVIEVIEKIMYDNHLNQTQFAVRIGVKPSQVSEWLNGKNKPGYEKLQAICNEFDVDANLLLGTNKKPSKE